MQNNKWVLHQFKALYLPKDPAPGKLSEPPGRLFDPLLKSGRPCDPGWLSDPPVNFEN